MNDMEQPDSRLEPQALKATYSQRFGYALSVADDSDYYSLDGKTWDPSADWNLNTEHIFTFNDFKSMIIKEIDKIMAFDNQNPPTEDQLAPELKAWLLRVEEKN